jgi:hypothetical protein
LKKNAVHFKLCLFSCFRNIHIFFKTMICTSTKKHYRILQLFDFN